MCLYIRSQCFSSESEAMNLKKNSLIVLGFNLKQLIKISLQNNLHGDLSRRAHNHINIIVIGPVLLSVCPCGFAEATLCTTATVQNYVVQSHSH